ncbi:hypothetical protein TNCV_2952911 [Trichonephila clavipes]|nr:hypothetical protein TNCV_2952911 [Trichonephila clavipes]
MIWEEIFGINVESTTTSLLLGDLVSCLALKQVVSSRSEENRYHVSIETESTKQLLRLFEHSEEAVVDVISNMDHDIFHVLQAILMELSCNGSGKEDLDKVNRDTTPAEDRYLTINAHQYRLMTAKKLAQDFTAVTGKTIFRQTVYRRLAKNALYTRWLVICVPLNLSKKKKLVFYEAKNMCLEQIKSGAVYFSLTSPGSVPIKSSFHLERAWDSLPSF